MFALFGKKKLTENKLSNIAVNALLDAVDQGYPEMVELIKNSPELVTIPEIKEEYKDRFILIVLAANLQLVPKHLDAYCDKRVIDSIISKFSLVFDENYENIATVVKEYQSFLKRINHPSDNTIYSMSKAVFHKFELYDFQEEYFRHLKSPNPLFIKRLDEVMPVFIFDWKSISNQYQLVES